MLELVSLDLLFLQKTMLSDDKAHFSIGNLVKDWDISVVDLEGHSSGILCAWNPCVIKVSPLSSSAGIWLEGWVLAWDFPINFLNYNRPYHNRKHLWHKIIKEGLLNLENVKFGRDLNFTLSLQEVWGIVVRQVSLADFFYNMIWSVGLLDVELPEIVPTCIMGGKAQMV